MATLRLARNVAIALAAIALIGMALSLFFHIVPNFTDSMPVGFYQAQPIGSEKLTRGDIVIACMPKWAIAYRRRAGFSLLNGPCAFNSSTVVKFVAALPGDTVSVSTAGVAINGVLWPETRLHATNSEGGPIPHGFAGRTVVVAPGDYWLLTPMADSFDSRYWGPATAILSRARPVLTWPSMAAFTARLPRMTP